MSCHGEIKPFGPSKRQIVSEMRTKRLTEEETIVGRVEVALLDRFIRGSVAVSHFEFGVGCLSAIVRYSE